MSLTRVGRSVPPPMILAMLTLAAGCSSPLSGGMAAKSPAPHPSPKPVRVVHPEPVTEDEGFSSSLYVERDVKVTARRSGIIEEVLADRGSWVRAGDRLATLETDVASRELELAEHDLRLAVSEYERLRILNEQGIASPQEFQRAEIARDQATSKVGLARAMRERCDVRAPFGGRVAERWAVVGKRVREEDDVPLFRIVASEPLRARIDVPEERLAGIRIGDRARVDFTVTGEPLRPARVVFVSQIVDAASGAAPVIVELAPPNDSLRVGESVRVRFGEDSGAPDPPVRLPREALLAGSGSEGNEATLLVVADGQAAARRVEWVRSEGTRVTVRGALAPADRVIVWSAGGLKAGDPVRAEEASP